VRHEFTKAVKRAAADRSRGFCEREGCGVRLPSGGFHFDHVISDWMGGEPTLENCEVLCLKCHRKKTSEQDQPAIARAKRVLDRERGIKPRSHRPMPFGRSSPLKKKITGEVVPR